MQDGKPRLLGYASKSLPEACQNFSVKELEMTGLAINIHLWKHLLLRVDEIKRDFGFNLLILSWTVYRSKWFLKRSKWF